MLEFCNMGRKKKQERKHKLPLEREIAWRRIARKALAGEDIKEAIKAEGYGKTYSEKPCRITSKESFRELIREYMSDSFLLDQHKRLFTEHRDIKQITIDTIDDDDIAKATEGLENVTVIKRMEEGYTILIINQIDRQARREATDLAYKIMGAYAPAQVEVKREGEDIPDDEILALLRDKMEGEPN